MAQIDMCDVMGTIDELLAAGKKPAMWERLDYLSGDALAKKQMEVLENVAKGLLDYANTNGIGKEMWAEATKEAALMSGYEWRYIHHGIMHEAVKTVRERMRAAATHTDFTDLGEIIEQQYSEYNKYRTTPNKTRVFTDWIKRHRVAQIPPNPNGWNSSENQMEYVAQKLGVDIKTNGNNRVAIRMFLEDHNNKKSGKPYIDTKIAVKDREVMLYYET